MTRSLPLFILLIITTPSRAQELFVFTEPASNMPAHSLSLKLTDHFVTRDEIYNRFSQRLMPQLMFGLNKNWMLHVGATFGNMHTRNYRYESVNFYAKYRFLSNDEIHRHFRMAAFIDASNTNAPFHYDEITLMGDKSGVEAGLIATQLWNKFALSGTISHTQVFDRSRNDDVIYVPARAYSAMNYAVSAGYLLLPRAYHDYHQTNLNIYTEILAEQTLDVSRYAIDLAPALQLIFNSNTKLNLGYRFQVSGNMQRMNNHSWQLSVERTLLDAFNRKKS